MCLKTLSIIWLTQDQIKTVDQFLFVLPQQWKLYRQFGGLEFDLKLHTAEKNKRVTKDNGVQTQVKKQQSKCSCSTDAKTLLSLSTDALPVQQFVG